MAKYDSIHGTIVRSYATDPDTLITGHVWYDKTAKTLQYQAASPAGAWSSGNNMNTGRASAGGAGTQTAGLGFGGVTPPQTDKTESYNGSSWTEVADLQQTGTKLEGFGTSTAAIACGGDISSSYSDRSETWNGSAWSEGNNLNQARNQMASISGITTAGLVFGGQGPPPGMQDVTESYNGTSWTEVSDLNLARYGLSGAGTATAGLAFGGSVDPGDKGETESWNGSSWTEVNDLNTGDAFGAGFGTATAALFIKPSTTEQFNGTSWTEVADTATPRGGLAPAQSGTTTAGLVFGGDSASAVTEEWNAPTLATKTVDTD